MYFLNLMMCVNIKKYDNFHVLVVPASRTEISSFFWLIYELYFQIAHKQRLVFCHCFSDITEIGRSAKAYCEHTARSVPTLSDTVVTLIEMGKLLEDTDISIIRSYGNVIKLTVIESVCVSAGFNVDTLPVYAKRSQRMVITARKYSLCSPLLAWIMKLMMIEIVFFYIDLSMIKNCLSAPVTNAPVTPRALSAGLKRTHPAHIPSHFPEFPDPHTYIKTPVSHCLYKGLSNKKNYSLLLVIFKVCFPFFRRSESRCQTTRWWERKQRLRGGTWNEHSHASWPRPERRRASSKTTSPPSHVSDSAKR